MVIGVMASGIVAGIVGVVAMLIAGVSVLGALAFYPVAGLIGATLITASVTRDGETNWLEGAMLLGVYLLIALAFFFLPAV